ncbi:hypothetical protein Taro_035663, partial [Colocasia esculenta]|nr:hypothetical protein [Colocasia esculenta]
TLLHSTVPDRDIARREADQLHAELARIRTSQAGASSSRAATEGSQSDLADQLAGALRRAEEVEGDEILEVDKYHWLWRAMVGAVLRLGRMSRGVRRGVSSRPQHPRVPQYFLHHHLWIMACSCKAWFRQCRPRRRRRWYCRLTCRHRLRLQLPFLRIMAMVVRPSWRGLRGWIHHLLRGESAPLGRELDEGSGEDLTGYKERADVWWALLGYDWHDD